MIVDKANMENKPEGVKRKHEQTVGMWIGDADSAKWLQIRAAFAELVTGSTRVRRNRWADRITAAGYIIMLQQKAAPICLKKHRKTKPPRINRDGLYIPAIRKSGFSFD